MTSTTKSETGTAPEVRTSGGDADIDLTTDDAIGRGIQSWFDRWADGVGMRLPDMFGNRLPEFWGASREMGGVIRIEETADDDGIVIRGELPGIDPDKDVEITVENGRLSISAERHQKEETKTDGRTRTEFRYGSYRRSLSLPAGTNTDAITATYENGILEVRVPVDGTKAEAAKIPITTS